MQTQGVLECDDTGTAYDDTAWIGEWEIPEGEIYAQSKEEAVNLFKWIRLGDGVWTLTLTADIGEDNSPLSTDNGCESTWEIELYGIDGIRAAVDED